MKRTGTDDVTEQIPKGVHYLNSFYNKAMAEWPWRYRSRSKAIKCKTPSHASNHLWKIKIQSIQKLYRLQSRHDKICYISAFFCKVRQEWHIRQGQKSLYMTHPLMLVVICAKYGEKIHSGLHVCYQTDMMDLGLMKGQTDAQTNGQGKSL